MPVTRSQAARIVWRVPGSLIALTIGPVLVGSPRVAPTPYPGVRDNGWRSTADRPPAPALHAINVTPHSIIAYGMTMERGLGPQLRRLLELRDRAVAESYAREPLRYPLIAGAVLMTVLFGMTPLTTAPRIGLGLGIGAVLALPSGLVSLLRSQGRGGPSHACH